jgi:DNA-binding transcriptional MerR regulator
MRAALCPARVHLETLMRRHMMSNCKDSSAAQITEALVANDAANDLDLPATETVLSLENVARMFSVSRLTLRYYEFRGLIKRRHRIGQVPVYGWADCDRIAFIIKCRRVGLLLGEVAPIIAAVDHEDDTFIHKRGQEACMRLVTRLEKRRKILDDALAELSHTYSLLTMKILGPKLGAHLEPNRTRSCD